MTRSDTTFEQFQLLCGKDVVAHVDITQAPSYQRWYRVSHAMAKRKGEFCLQLFMRDISLHSLGFDMAFYPKGKAAEYAYCVATELGLKPKVNQSKFKGTDWDITELYARLPE